MPRTLSGKAVSREGMGRHRRVFFKEHEVGGRDAAIQKSQRVHVSVALETQASRNHKTKWLYTRINPW